VLHAAFAIERFEQADARALELSSLEMEIYLLPSSDLERAEEDLEAILDGPAPVGSRPVGVGVVARVRPGSRSLLSRVSRSPNVQGHMSRSMPVRCGLRGT